MWEVYILLEVFRSLSSLKINSLPIPFILHYYRYKEGRVILEYALINEAEGYPNESGNVSH